MIDPVHAARAAKRAKKRRRRTRPAEAEQWLSTGPLVSQGARSQRPPPRRPTADDVLREAAWAARGKPRWVRV
jgi:hypothetical protein